MSLTPFQPEQMPNAAQTSVGTHYSELLVLGLQMVDGKAANARKHASIAANRSSGPVNRILYGRSGSSVQKPVLSKGSEGFTARNMLALIRSQQVGRDCSLTEVRESGLPALWSGMTLYVNPAESEAATCTRITSSRGRIIQNYDLMSQTAQHSASSAIEPFIALTENRVNSVEPLTSRRGQYRAKQRMARNSGSAERVTARQVRPTIILPKSARRESDDIAWAAWKHADAWFKRPCDNKPISPMDTVFMSGIERTTAKSTVHEWLTDTLTAAAANAAVEGDAFSAVAVTPPARLKNYCQISRKDIEVTGTTQAVDNAGMAKLMAYYTARAGKMIKRDMEFGFLQNVAATSGGASLSARVSAGAENWIYIPNHIATNGTTTASTVAPASGFATGAVTDGSATAFVNTGLTAMLQQAWSTGGETDVILCGPTLYNTISAFTGIATRFRNVEARSQAQIIGAADKRILH